MALRAGDWGGCPQMSETVYVSFFIIIVIFIFSPCTCKWSNKIPISSPASAILSDWVTMEYPQREPKRFSEQCEPSEMQETQRFPQQVQRGVGVNAP